MKATNNYMHALVNIESKHTNYDTVTLVSPVARM